VEVFWYVGSTAPVGEKRCCGRQDVGNAQRPAPQNSWSQTRRQGEMSVLSRRRFTYQQRIARIRPPLWNVSMREQQLSSARQSRLSPASMLLLNNDT